MRPSMKNTSLISNIFVVCFIVIQLCLGANKILAQPTNTDLLAFNLNGKIGIRLINSNLLNTYFNVSQTGSVGMDFYFGPDDVRNGFYSAMVAPQPGGYVNLGFIDIPYLPGDTLTFIATELMSAGNIREYVFIDGLAMFSPGGPITVCPTHLSCSGKKILLHFNPAEIILALSSVNQIQIQLSIPNAGVNINMTVGPLNIINLQQNAIVLKDMGVDCSKVMSSDATLVINGITCKFRNGLLVSSNCTDWVDIPDDLGACAPYFEECTIEMQQLLAETQYTLPCRQWIDYNLCSTSSLISRPGKVAIGTTAFSPLQLTVKNGIITDMVKVTNTGWGDHVFEDGYPLLTLEDVESFIAKHQHLHGSRSGNEIEAEGSFELGETTVDHQIKIEEIFLHLIKLEEEIADLELQLFLLETKNKRRD
jgi:hypothetical protein